MGNSDIRRRDLPFHTGCFGAIFVGALAVSHYIVQLNKHEEEVAAERQRLQDGMDCMVDAAYGEGLLNQQEKSLGNTRFGYDPPRVHFEVGDVFSASDFRHLIDGHYASLGIEQCMKDKRY